MSFMSRVQYWDADYGIPRRADEPYLPSFHAFTRLIQDIGQMAICVLLCFTAALFLWIAGIFFGLSFYAQVINTMVGLSIILVGLYIAGSTLIPYHQFNQLLTYGTQQWASAIYLEDKEFARPFDKPLKKGELQLGKLPRALNKPYQFLIPAASVLGSFIFFGPPGMGKSVLLMNYLKQWALSLCSAIIIDPKAELYAYIARFFRKVYRIDFINPEYSDRWNFLLNCRKDKEYAHLMATAIIGLEANKQTNGDPFWPEAELALLTAILMYLAMRLDHPTPPMIHQFIACRTLEQLTEELGNSSDPDINHQWGTFSKASPVTQGSVFTGLATKLHPFTINAAAAVTAQLRKQEYERGARYVDFNELREPGVAIFLVIPEGAAARYQMPIGTFFAEAIESLRTGEITEDTTPVMLVVDEAAHIPIRNKKEIVGVGRGRKFFLMQLYQNLAQGRDQHGEEGFDAILEATNTITFLSGCSGSTAEYASRLVGQTTVWGHSYDDAPGTQNDKSRSTEVGRPLIDPSEVRQLLKHKQAITVTETMPPIKWTFPPRVDQGPKLIPRKYGKPLLISYLDAVRLTDARRQRDRELSQSCSSPSSPEILEVPQSDLVEANAVVGNIETTAREINNDSHANAASQSSITLRTEDSREDNIDKGDVVSQISNILTSNEVTVNMSNETINRNINVKENKPHTLTKIRNQEDVIDRLVHDAHEEMVPLVMGIEQMLNTPNGSVQPVR
jgi:hypothetical protein